MAAQTIQGRMLAASGCAYGIDPNTGKYIPPASYDPAVGWLAPPTTAVGGTDGIDIDAALIGQNQDGIIIAFRGTLPPSLTIPCILDWWQDVFDAVPVTVGNIPGQVHSGFWAALKSIWGQIEAECAPLIAASPNAKIYLTGHSKGGSMTTIAAANIYFNPTALPKPAAIYAFAPAHPGDVAFAAGFPLATIPVTRYENYLDIVPFLPPNSPFIDMFAKIPVIGDIFKVAENWNYSTLGTLQFIKQDHTIVPDSALLEPERLWAIFGQLLHGQAGFESIANAHSLDCGDGYQQGVAPDIQCVANPAVVVVAAAVVVAASPAVASPVAAAAAAVKGI